MAAEGWVRVPQAHATAGPGFELKNLWGQMTGGQHFPTRREQLRYQMPDGSLRMVDTNGKGVSENRRPRDFPVWSSSPPAAQPQQQGNHVSPFAGARDANLQRINSNPAFAAPAAQPPAAPRRQPPAAPAAAPAAQPPASRPPAAQPPAAPPAGAASLNHASAVISGLQDRFGPQPLVAENSSFSVEGTPQLQQTAANLTATPAARHGGVVMGDAELNQRRRSAFLDASDSMSGLKAVRGLLGEQAQARGADISGGGAIPSVRFLEGQLAKHPAQAAAKPMQELSAGDQKAWGQMAFEGQPITSVLQGASGAVAKVPSTGTPALEGGGLSPSQIAGQSFAAATPELAPQAVIPSGAPRAAVNAYMQTALKGKLQAGQQPLDQIAQWQLTPQPITAPRTDPGREAKLAAFAAQRETPPATEGEALLAAGASNAFGTRGGLFKPGNTVNLGFADPSKLPPLNSTGHYSGVSYGSNPGNYQRLF